MTFELPSKSASLLRDLGRRVDEAFVELIHAPWRAYGKKLVGFVASRALQIAPSDRQCVAGMTVDSCSTADRRQLV